MSRVFSRGLNFMGQLGIKNGKTNLKDFQEIPSLHGQQILQVEAHITQSACLLADGQILNWGWVLDSLTTARTLNYYKRWPNFVQKWQKYSPFGPTLGMRIGFDEPNLLNKAMLSKHKPTKISLGGSFIICLSSSGDAFGSGENYKGQLGTGDIKFKHDFTIIDKPTTEKILDVVAGFQHSLYLADEGSCFATGRCNWRQYLPFSVKPEDKEKYIDFNRDPQKIIMPGEKIVQLGAGFAHSLFLTSKNKLYAIGLNNYGQCGHSSLNKNSLSDYSEVFVNLEPNDEIVDIKCGKSHNLLLTKQGYVYGFGASSHNQLNWKNEFGLEVCGPRRIDLPLKDEKVIKIKATIDRNAVITDKGNCYVWGGENLQKLGGEAGDRMQNIREQIPGNPKVKDVGLGYMHTLALTE